MKRKYGNVSKNLALNKRSLKKDSKSFLFEKGAFENKMNVKAARFEQ